MKNEWFENHTVDVIAPKRKMWNKISIKTWLGSYKNEFANQMATRFYLSMISDEPSSSVRYYNVSS